MRYLMLLAMLQFTNLNGVYAQDTTKQSLILTTGIGLSAQDRRLFFWPHAKELLEREKKTVDYEYNISIQKAIIQRKQINVYAGIGYSEYNSTFSRPFDQSEFGSDVKVIDFIKKYTINKVIVPVSGEYLLLPTQKIYLNFYLLPNFMFRKSIKQSRFNQRNTKWRGGFTALELYSGVSKRINKRLSFGINCRAFYMNKIDPAIFYAELFRYPDYSFMEKKFDLHNPFKLWFTAEYRLGK